MEGRFLDKNRTGNKIKILEHFTGMNSNDSYINSNMFGLFHIISIIQ